MDLSKLRYNPEASSFITTMPHVKLHCTDIGPGCEGGTCNLCQLFTCAVCGGAECCLPVDCPGERFSNEQADLICAGKLDYLQGEWVRTT
jgi:hypothetical protein